MTTLGDKMTVRARWDAETAGMVKYVRSCRKAEKRAYAEHYAGWLLKMATEPDERSYDLSYMGAQAVRHSLATVRAACEEVR